MYGLYVTCLIWTGIFKRFSTPKRHAMLKRCGYEVMDNTELNLLLKQATRKAKEQVNESAT